MNQQDYIAYMLSFLGILIDRAGGTLVITRLSEYANYEVGFTMKLDIKGDQVTLISKRNKISDQEIIH